MVEILRIQKMEGWQELKTGGQAMGIARPD